MLCKKIEGTCLNISSIGLGCAALSGGYRPRDEVRAAKILSVALDFGITFSILPMPTGMDTTRHFWELI